MQRKPLFWLVTAGFILVSGLVMWAATTGDDNKREESFVGQAEYIYTSKCGGGTTSEHVKEQGEEEKHSEKCTCDKCKGKDGKCKPDCKCPHHSKADKDSDGKEGHSHEHKCGEGKCGEGKCGM